MKRNAFFSLLLAALLLLAPCAPARAESDFDLDGVIACGERVTVTAPFGGRVLDFELAAGDSVAAGDTLLALDTVKLYAPCDGIVAGVRAQAGDAAAFIQERYGALLYLEPEGKFIISATTAEAYDDENRYVMVGEQVYLKSTENGERTGTGVITAVQGASFTVEVRSGGLIVDEKVGIFRDAGYKSASRVGRGRTARQNPVPITGEGSVLRVHVREGERVARGTLLLETVSGALEGLAGGDNAVAAPASGTVASVLVAPGETVAKDQPLAVLYPEGALRIEARVAQSDIGRVRVGGAVRVEMEYETAEPLMGSVTAISALNAAAAGDAEYTVYIDFTPDGLAREGMTVTVYPL